MFSIIIKVLFFIIGKIADIVLLPINLIFQAVFPSLIVGLDGIFTFLEFAFSKFVFCLKLVMIPSLAFNMIYTILLAGMVIAGIATVRFAIMVYYTLKP